jgi:hypothetical protein
VVSETLTTARTTLIKIITPPSVSYVIGVMPSGKVNQKVIPLPPSLAHGQTHKGDRVPHGHPVRQQFVPIEGEPSDRVALSEWISFAGYGLCPSQGTDGYGVPLVGLPVRKRRGQGDDAPTHASQLKSLA